MKQAAKLKRTWNLAPVLLIVQKIPENYFSCLDLSIGYVWWLNELWFKRYIQKCTMSLVLILIMMSQIWKIMGWLKITWIFWEQNIAFVRNKKILSLWFRWHIFRSYRFVAEVTFKKILTLTDIFIFVMSVVCEAFSYTSPTLRYPPIICFSSLTC